jgi:hypothetical protein
MLKLKKFFLAFAMVAALGWATSASAQVGLQVSSDVQEVNGNSLAAGVGQILLSSTSTGTIVTDSTLSVDYGVDIISSDLDGDFADPAAPVTISVGCAVGTDIDGSIITITFTADCAFVPGDNIVFSGIRVDANDAGVGATITGDVSATVPSTSAATNPITFIGDTSPDVAEVLDAFEIEIEQGRTVLTCTENDVTTEDVERIFVTISELFNQAFASEDDEIGLAEYTGPEVEQTFEVTFKDVPADVNIRLLEINLDGPGGLDLGDDGDALLPLVRTGDDDDVVFSFTIDATSGSGSNEEIELVFDATTDDSIDLVDGGLNINVGIAYAAGELSDGEVPEYVDNEVEDRAFVVSDCLTRLLLSWAAVNASGFDTGVTFANTTEDDAGYEELDGNPGAIAQDGTCTLTGYKSTDGSTVQFTTPEIGAGETHPQVLSSVSGFNGFTGYILAVCNFLNAHAFAFITNGFGSVTGPTIAEGAQWNVVPLASRVIPAGEGLNH